MEMGLKCSCNDLKLRSLIQEIETLNGIQLKNGRHVLSDSNLDAGLMALMVIMSGKTGRLTGISVGSSINVMENMNGIKRSSQ